MKNSLFLIALHINLAYSYKILGLFPHPGKSHVDIFVPIMKGLARRGHDITVVSHFPLKKPEPRYRDLSLNAPDNILLAAFPLSQKSSTLLDKILTVFLLSGLQQTSCESGFQSQEVQRLINSEERYDIIIAEFFNSYCFLAFAHKFSVPVVGLSSCVMTPWTAEVFAQPNNPSYVPEHFLSHADKMLFWERVSNTVALLFHEAVYRYVVQPRDQRIAEEYFREALPPLEEIARSSSVLLVNTHFSLNLPRPNVPGVIEIGGIHIGVPKSLPKVSAIVYPFETNLS